MLDHEEYLHLAITAVQNSDHQKALELLHNAIELEPNSAGAHYLLGAIYADIKLYDRAVTQMEKSLELDPKLEIAQFQLAMLYAYQGKTEEPKALFSQLKQNASDANLAYFSDALLTMMDQQLSQAIEKLEAGLTCDNVEPHLKNSMSNILDNLKQQQSEQAQGTEKQESERDKKPGVSILSAYSKSSFTEDTE